MQESEITADITKESFDKYIKRFTKELGIPEIKHRVSFMILERGKPLDNRIKITNGRAKIVQKLKTPPNSLGKRVNEEIEIDISNNLVSIKDAIKLLQHFYDIYNIQPLKLIVQHENYIWLKKDYELKIAKQFGKQDLYLYEIETLSNITPESIQNKLGIKADFDSFSLERQALRRNDIDIPFDELKENELDEIILKYLNYKNY